VLLRWLRSHQPWALHHVWPQVIGDEILKGFGSGRHRFAELNMSADGLPPLTPNSGERSARSRIQLMRASTTRTPTSGAFVLKVEPG